MQREITIDAFSNYDYFEHKGEHIIEGHCHDTWKINIVMEGQMTATCSDKILHLNKGDILIVAPWVYHRFKVGKDGVKRAVISFNSHEKDEIPEFLAKSLSADEFALARLCTEDLSALCAGDGSVMLNTTAQYKNGIKMCEILLYRVYNSAEQLMNCTTMEAKIYSKTVRYMEDHITESLAMDYLSKELHVGQAILKKIFRDYTDGGTITYFHNMKIRYAIMYLMNGYSVTDVSEMLGFSSVNHFSTFFKKMVGESPKRYQMQMKLNL